MALPCRFLGDSGLKVTIFGFGNWVTGHKKEDEELQIQVIKKAHDLGIRFFDTAEVYGYGVAEEVMGRALKDIMKQTPRESLVVSTKLFWGKPGDQNPINEVGLSRKHIQEGMKNSLKRLDLEYVDVVFCHRPDVQTPLEETCRAMSNLIDQGKSFYWGTSEWSGADIAASIEICNRLNLHKPICEQPQYNMLSRDRFEKEYRPLFERYKYGTTIWSPMKMGILSGKYNSGEIPQGSRLESNPNLLDTFNKLFSEKNKEKSVQMFKDMQNLCKELGCQQSQLALAWTLMNTDVSTCLLGASKPEQLDENLKALEICKKWTKEIEDKINKILDNQPENELCWKSWKPRNPRRLDAFWDAKF